MMQRNGQMSVNSQRNLAVTWERSNLTVNLVGGSDQGEETGDTVFILAEMSKLS